MNIGTCSATASLDDLPKELDEWRPAAEKLTIRPAVFDNWQTAHVSLAEQMEIAYLAAGTARKSAASRWAILPNQVITAHATEWGPELPRMCTATGCRLAPTRGGMLIRRHDPRRGE